MQSRRVYFIVKVFVNGETALLEEHFKHKDFSYPFLISFFAFNSQGAAALVTIISVPVRVVPQVSP